ncbi:MAG: putative peptidoglycan glycosyltransferase FtsW [Lachnospiraceae bacterium]|nr:putative peptidoglycan glycosyltransferase FtsW [Lachnospiraceae bacterium]
MSSNVRDAVSRVRNKSDYYDYNLLAAVILLTCFGLVMLYSTSAYMAELKFGNDMYYFKKQALISLACILLAILVSFVDYHVLSPLGGVIFLAAFILMALVQTPLGVEVNGARRWLNLGIQFQPSEVAKIAVIVFVPIVIVRMGRRFQGLKACIFPLALGLVLGFGAYKFTENLSTAIIIVGIACVIVFIAHPRTAPFVLIMVAAVVVVGAAIFILSQTMESSDSFRLRRVLVWLDPEKYSEEGGYQILQALYALGSGGFFGKGLGNSTQKLGSVPEAQNDMIFSIVCEELGIFGGAIVLLLFGYLIYRLFFIAQNAPDLFGSLMVVGIMAHISLQVILNICVVINLVPTTGITLPFISYGGTSVFFLMMEMALALSVSRKIKFQKEERDLWGEVV